MSVTIDGILYCCGTCYWWTKEEGCTMPPSPSTVNCGRTEYDNLCEQWTEQTELQRFRMKIATPYRRKLRAAHYLDGAKSGYDS
jgi:hypothetical protein